MSESPRTMPNDAELADQIVELSALTGGLAHEIRNPLSTLKVNLQLLDEDWQRVETAPAGGAVNPADVARRGRKRLATLLDEADRLERILADFLQYVGRGELHPVPTDAAALLSEMADFFAPQAVAHAVDFTIETPPTPLIVPLDVVAMKQALLNLLINAQQAMPKGGRLVLRLTADDDERIRIDVTDTGAGVPEALREKIFQAYYSTKPGGTGLGLATARQIVRRHGGDISVEPNPAGGSCFKIVLPRPAPAAP